MRSIALPYGETTVEVRLPASLEVVVAQPPGTDAGPAAGPADELRAVEEALDAPLGAPRLEERARGLARVTVVVPDRTRAAGVRRYLPAILARLARAGVSDDAVTVLVGGGIHAPAAGAEAAELVGEDVARRVRVLGSDADDAASFVDVAADRAVGSPRLHRAVVETDLVVVTGAVAPHYLAGWSGGAKAIVPGCADRATVEAVHRLTLDATVGLDGSVRSPLGSSASNPFRAAIERVASRAAPAYALLTGTALGRIVHAHAGDVAAAHEAAVSEHRRRFATSRPAPADLVIAGGGAPRDRDLLQAHKGLVVACDVAKAGAPVVWLAHARDGAGHPRFLPWFEAGRLERHVEALRRAFHPYGLTAYALRWKAARNPVHAVSTQTRDMLRPMGLLAFDDAQSAVDAAIAAYAPTRCVVLPRALETFFA